MNTDSALPAISDSRKSIPLASGLLDYFPAALAAVAQVSLIGGRNLSSEQPLRHLRGVSGDHADALLRHLVDRGSVDPQDGLRHSAKVAWRALALLQEELEADVGVPLPRAAVPAGTCPGVEVVECGIDELASYGGSA